MSHKGHIDRLLNDPYQPNREGWGYERVTEPRKSCDHLLTVRNQLRALFPGEHTTIGGHVVKRLEAVSLSDRYSVDYRGRYTLEDALARLAGEAEVAA